MQQTAPLLSTKPEQVIQTGRAPLTHAFIPSDGPVLSYCSGCAKVTKSTVSRQPGPPTFLAGSCLMPLLLCWVPCYVEKCKDAFHRCEVCGGFLGVKPAFT